jgi:hypothetical protein
VCCDDCRFAWYGASAADGLRVLNACPHCGGHLSFRDDAESDSSFAVTESLKSVAPAAVLGTPFGWAR